MYGWLLRLHPFFADMQHAAPTIIRRICHSAVQSMPVDQGAVVFTKGEVPEEPKMYFIIRGTLEYHYSHGEPATVREKQWVSEGALWTRWKHQGTLMATTDCKMAVLDAKEFQTIMA